MGRGDGEGGGEGSVWLRKTTGKKTEISPCSALGVTIFSSETKFEMNSSKERV